MKSQWRWEKAVGHSEPRTEATDTAARARLGRKSVVPGPIAKAYIVGKPLPQEVRAA